MELFTLKLLLFGVLLGIDNLVVSIGIGEFSLSKKRKTLLISLFFIAETALPLLGAVVAEQLLTLTPLIELIELMGLTLAALLVFLTVRYSAFFSHFTGSKAQNNYYIFLLPFLLGLDNLTAGAAQHSSGMWVVFMGIVSAVTCGAGLALGAWLKNQTALVAVKPGLLSACCLAGAALFTVIGEIA